MKFHSIKIKDCKAIWLGVICLLAILSCGGKSTKSTIEDTIPILKTGLEKPMPMEWIDKDTGHKVRRLVNRKGGNRSFYFHNNPFLENAEGTGNAMVFYGNTPTTNQIFLFDMENGTTKQVTTGEGSKKGEILGPKTRKVYYMVADSIFATHVDTGDTQFIFKFPSDVIGSVTSLNADETLLGGALITKEENEIFQKNPDKSDYFNKIYEAKLERSLFIIDVETKQMRTIYSENAWLNHIQFSPTDPKLLMYCHEGPWHKVDRIWTIDIETGENQLMHKRTVYREIAGHEFFSPDGKQIWYDLQIPRGETFYLASKSVDGQDSTRYSMKRDEWSIHFNIAPNQKTFVGDGGDEGQVAQAKDGRWLYHFKPNGDSLQSEKLVNMKHHDYDLEPNVHFSPDGTSIIFRANFEGQSEIYEVEIAKNQQDED